MINKSRIDGDGNIVIQDSNNATITINTDNPEEIRKFFIEFQNSLQNLPNEILDLMESKNPNAVEIDNDANMYLSFNFLADSFGGIEYALGVTITNLTKEIRFFNNPFFKTSESIENGLDTFMMTEPIQGANFPKRLEYGEVISESYKIKPAITEILDKVLAKNQDAFIQALSTTTLGEVYKSNKYSVKQLRQQIIK
jgi:hypothetical protein